MKWFLTREEETTKNPSKEEVVECADCKHLIRKNIAQEVKTEYRSHHYGYGNPDPIFTFYCNEHKKPYTLIVVSYGYCDGTHCPYNTTKDKTCGMEHEQSQYFIPCEPWKQVDEKGKEIK